MVSVFLPDYKFTELDSGGLPQMSTDNSKPTVGKWQMTLEITGIHCK
jgi:hypothetical protein